MVLENKHTQIDQWLEENEQQLVEMLSELIRIPSENRPPYGNEKPVQQIIKQRLQDNGFECELYSLIETAGLTAHEAYWPGRDYSERPNLIGCKRGSGGGRSLMFSVHADVVLGVKGKYEPFTPQVVDRRLYGRGSNDMKGGIAAVLLAMQFLSEHRMVLQGDLYVESVVDEEMGGANGSLAGRLKGITADAVIIPEPTNLKVCTSHLGGIMWRMTLMGKGGMGFGGEEILNPVYGMANILKEIESYHKELRQIPLTAEQTVRPNVVLSTIVAGDFEPGMSDGVPASCFIDIWIECIAGVTEKDMEVHFKQRMEAVCARQEMAGFTLVWEQLTRFIPGTRAVHSQLPAILLKHVHQQCGLPEVVSTAPFACDAFMFNLYSPSPMPAIIMGPIGENAHTADEMVDLDSLLNLTKVYILSMMEWCEVQPA